MDNNTMRYNYSNIPNNYQTPGTYSAPQHGGTHSSHQNKSQGCGCGSGSNNPLIMQQSNNNSSDCGCKDYSLLTGNTGITALSTANSNLDGSGTLSLVITGAANGTKVRSITIKATEAVKTGMIRLFIKKAGVATTLYQELQIPEWPVLAATPTPTPILPVFEMKIICNLELRNGYSLVASTQNTAHFNVIAEGLDYAYPGTLPNSCCNFLQNSSNNGLASINTANTNLDGSGSITAVYTAGVAGSASNGSKITSIKIKAQQNTHEGMVRIFISNDAGTTYFLFREIYIPESVPSAYSPSFEYTINECFYLKNGYIIGASTQKAEGFAITIEGDDWKYPIS